MTNEPLIFNGWELQYLQTTINRWYDYKGVGSFSDAEHRLIESIKTKVQVVDGTTILLTPEESNFLQTIIYTGQQDYGRSSGSSLVEDTRGQRQQRTVQITADILAKLRNATPPIINPGETEALES